MVHQLRIGATQKQNVTGVDFGDESAGMRTIENRGLCNLKDT